MKSIILLLTISLYSAFGFAQDCAPITITGGSGQISITGVPAVPIATVQVFNSSWASVFNQTYTNPSGTITVTPMPAGQYFVNVRLSNANWSTICEKGGNATVTSGTPPPAANCGGTFQKTFGAVGGDDQAYDIVKASDGNFLLAGHAAASGNTNHDGIVMKVDNAGNLLWSKTLGGSQEDFLNMIAPTADGGCLAGGVINSNGPATYSGDTWLVRLDGSGNVLWQKRYFVTGSPGNIMALTATSDGGYAFSGTFPLAAGASDWMVVKIDANGNVQWQKKLGSNSSDNSIGIIEDNHNEPGVIVCGNIYSGTWYDAVITKLDMTGAVVWTKSYDFDSRANWLGPMYKVADGLIFNTMSATGYERENARVGILKTDFSGNIIWNREYTIGACRDSRLTPLADGGFMMVQSEYPHQDAVTDIHLLRIDATGNNVLWSKKYSRAGAQFLWNLAPDGNYVMGGGFTASGSYNDVMLTRADLNGRMGNCSTANVTTTVRTPNSTPLGFNWTTNTPLNLSVVNTTYPVVAYNPAENVLCADNCPEVTIGNVTVSENAGNAMLQVCIAGPAPNDWVYNYTTANGSATSGSDYTGGSGTVTIAAGQTCGTITIPILNDAAVESAENFTVSIGSVSGTVTINDDDQAQGNCTSVTFTPGNSLITVTGVTAAVATVQVFNSSWATVFNQTYTNSPGTVNIPIGAGTYQVKVTFYTSSWGYICDKTDNVTVANSCPAGTICVTNSCPSQTVDLNTAYAPVLPAGTTVSWHTATPANDGNKMTPEQAQNVSVSGTYYAAINISGANCYSATIPVNVTIVACSSAALTNAVQLKIEGEAATKNITVFPNPFNNSLRVIIDSEKREKAELVLMDVQGRQLKQMPVQLTPGSNNVLLEGLGKFPSGNYFLKISSASGMKTMKVMRQQ